MSQPTEAVSASGLTSDGTEGLQQGFPVASSIPAADSYEPEFNSSLTCYNDLVWYDLPSLQPAWMDFDTSMASWLSESNQAEPLINFEDRTMQGWGHQTDQWDSSIDMPRDRSSAAQFPSVTFQSALHANGANAIVKAPTNGMGIPSEYKVAVATSPEERKIRGAARKPLAPCNRCRDRKTRCSGDKPACRLCKTAQTPCVYERRPKLRRPAPSRYRSKIRKCGKCRVSFLQYTPSSKLVTLPRALLEEKIKMQSLVE